MPFWQRASTPCSNLQSSVVFYLAAEDFRLGYSCKPFLLWARHGYATWVQSAKLGHCTRTPCASASCRKVESARTLLIYFLSWCMQGWVEDIYLPPWTLVNSRTTCRADRTMQTWMFPSALSISAGHAESGTSKLESKNCKQAMKYARPSPAIAWISGIDSNFISPFGSWLFTKKWETGTAPYRRGSYNFSQNKIQLMLWTIQWNVVWASHLPYSIPEGITVLRSIVTVLVEITKIE